MSESQTDGQTVPKPEGHIGPKVPKPEGHIGPKISQGPEGHIGPKSVDFGNQKKGKTRSAPHQIIISNTGSNLLNWSTSIPAGKNWLTLSKLKGQVAANSQETIEATTQAGSLVGVQDATLDFKYDDGSEDDITFKVNFQ